MVALARWWKLHRLDAASSVPAGTLALLREIPMLSVLTPRVVKRLAVFSGHTSGPDGTAVVTEGEHGDLCYVVESGRVAVSHGPELIRVLGPRDGSASWPC